MIIKKEYKFYAGHRNKEINGKCRNLHGHSYFLSIYFNVNRNGSISTLFSDFDDKIEPWIKKTLDHRFLLDINDSLINTFENHKIQFGEDLGMCFMPFPTSVENISAFIFFHLLHVFGFNVERTELKETTTSTLIYTIEDFNEDCKVSGPISLLLDFYNVKK